MRPEADAFSREAAGADGDGGLVGVVARALNVGERMEEREDALLLILLKTEIPQSAREYRAGEKERREMFEGDARDERHAEPHGGDDDGAAEVGLEENEKGDEERVAAGDQNVPDVRDFHVPARKVFRQDDDERELCQVGGLYREKTEVKTALRAFYDRAEDKDRCQEHDHNAVDADHDRRAAQERVFGDARDEEDDDRYRYPDDLFVEKYVLVAREGMHGDEAEERDGERRGKQEPVDMSEGADTKIRGLF